jgi:2-keto-4-pentenoate hydratase
MLFSSRSLAYAHALKEAQLSRKTMAPQASTLGLTPQTSVRTLNELHTFFVADGVTAVGRKLIAESPRAQAGSVDNACLGYLYNAQFANDDEEHAPIRTHGSTRLRLEPKLVLRFAAAPELSCGFEDFIAAIDAIAIAAELQLLPYTDASWRFEDKICANGFSKTIVVGELKTLSRNSKRNFSELLNHSSFSFSRTSASGSALIDFTPGHRTALSSIAELYRVMQQQNLSMPGTTLIGRGDLVALNAVCHPQPVVAGDEWVCVSTGLDLDSLRIRFIS